MILKRGSQYQAVMQAFQDSFYAMLILFPLILVRWNWGHLSQNGVKLFIGGLVQFAICWLILMIILYFPSFCRLAYERFRLAQREKKRRPEYVVRHIRQYLRTVPLSDLQNRALIRQQVCEIYKNAESRLKKYCGGRYP